MLSLRANSQSDPTVSQVLSETAARVGAISRAHDRLYRSSNVKRLELAAYLSEVCRDLDDAIPNCRVTFEASTTVYLTTDRAIQLAILLTELVTNAATHAYRQREGTVWVCLLPTSANGVSVSVRDEGDGLPEGFSLENSHGLGMRLVKVLAGQMAAELRIVRSERGTEFIVTAALDPYSGA